MEQPRLRTTLNRNWVLKMGLFTGALLVLCVWGALDAFWIYPARGQEHERFVLRDYLERVRLEGRPLWEASVEDPAGELRRLESGERGARPDSVEATRLVWLRSLSRIRNLERITEENRAEAARRAADPTGEPLDTPTIFADPAGLLDRLNREIGNKNVPKPLSGYDIPLQYLFIVLGGGGAAWMVFFLARCKGTVYRYDPSEKRLFLPDGRSFVPSEIESVDKRDWHKFYIYLRLAGQPGELRLDLLRYTPLEEWVLEMEKLHPGYTPEESADGDGSVVKAEAEKAEQDEERAGLA